MNKMRDEQEMLITGIGVTSAIGQGKKSFTEHLLQGKSTFNVMERPGRQVPVNSEQSSSTSNNQFLGAEIGSLTIPDELPKRMLRTSSYSAQVALVTLQEAWLDAQLNEVDPKRIGLVVGGSNFQQRELVLLHNQYRDKPHFLRPNYGHSFMDTDLCGLCTELFDIKGFAYTLGGASASGQVAVLQAIDSVMSGKVDVCIALGALMDLSYWELQAFQSIGAMGSHKFAQQPQQACRPFDQDRDGFIYGEMCGAVVVERASSIKREGVKPYARCLGGAIAMDGNRNPNPSLTGEISVIEESLKLSGLKATEVDYVNTHGTGSAIGDEIELKAIRHCGLDHAWLNATKSVIGHGLSAAGSVEIIATLLQMQASQLHPCVNLDNPMDNSYQWVRGESVAHELKQTLNLSLGFGGINSALCLQSLK